MFKLNIQEKNSYEAGLLKTLTMLCILFSLLRLAISGSIFYLFLIWNLFLAYIPWALSRYTLSNFKNQKKKKIVPFLILAWLFFFPNAPYILTDLFHLNKNSAMPMWFDLILILSFAWTGLLYGFFSLWNIEKVLESYLNPKATSFISYMLLFIGSFGVYIGRYLRWNSWDLIINPFKLFSNLGEVVFNPFHYPASWGMTLFLGVFLGIVYMSFRIIQNSK